MRFFAALLLTVNASRTVLFLAVGLVALGIGLWAGSRTGTQAPAAPVSAIVLPTPRALGAFQLADQDGAPFTPERLQGHWSLLFAGFTHCPDVCPTTLGVMKAVEQKLAAARLAPVQMIFLSVDPERDTSEALQRYVRSFSPTLVGTSGPKAELDKLTAALGLAYLKVEGAKPGEYSVDHSAALVLIDPQGRAAAYFQPPHRADTLASDLAKIIGPVAACPGLEVEAAWIREPAPGMDMTAGYGVLHNRGNAALTVDAAVSPAFGDASLHRSVLENGGYSMTPVPSLEIPAGGSAVLEPQGLHLMLMEPKQPLRAGDQVPVSFRCGREQTDATFTVRAGP